MCVQSLLVGVPGGRLLLPVVLFCPRAEIVWRFHGGVEGHTLNDPVGCRYRALVGRKLAVCDPAGVLVPVDHDYATHGRVQAAFEAMAPNTRRAGVSSLTVFVSALRKLQALAEVAPTARDQLVVNTMSGLARQAAAPRQVNALTVAALAAIYETACLRRVGRGGVLEGVETALRRGLVDIALCWVISDAGLRRSEAAALVWDDIARWDNGSGRLTVRRSKTDAAPRTVYLTPVAMAHLDAIRPEDADGSDPVFDLSVASISRRVKAAARAAGYSGHSGRVGMARRMARAGAPTHEIMAQGR